MTWNVKFSFCFTSKDKVIWKENPVVNQMSLWAFFLAPLELKENLTLHQVSLRPFQPATLQFTMKQMGIFMSEEHHLEVDIEIR